MEFPEIVARRGRAEAGCSKAPAAKRLQSTKSMIVLFFERPGQRNGFERAASVAIPGPSAVAQHRKVMVRCGTPECRCPSPDTAQKKARSLEGRAEDSTIGGEWRNTSAV